MYKDSKGRPISREKQPIGMGGEGKIYRTLGRYRGHLLKVYFKREYATKKAAKIAYMIQHSPLKNASAQLRQTIIWPVESAFKDGVFIGFLMPEVSQSIDLSWLLKTKIPFHKIGEQYQKFDWQNSDSWYYRLNVCYNLARALEYVHRSGQYTMVDLKPENLMISSSGIMSFIDTDSFQISGGGRLLFPAEAFTAAYSPRERTRLDLSRDRVSVYWSYFSFALLAYLILIGEHPFNGVTRVHNTEPGDHIVKGFYAHGPKYCYRLHDRHKPFRKLPKPLQKMFHLCFDYGLKRPAKRPTFTDWHKALDKAIETLYPIPTIDLTVNPAIIFPRQPVTFGWVVSNAHHVEVEGLGKVKWTDKLRFRPKSSTEVCLIATSGNRQVQKRARVEVVHEPYVIFEADPPMVQHGQSVKLSWSTIPEVRIEKTYLNGQRVYFCRSKRVKPIGDATYRLDLRWSGGRIQKHLHLKTSQSANA